jgi:hypothetical protein
MKLRRRQFLHVAAGAAALPAASRIARAQTYPARPVRLIVSAAPAGGTDITARLIGQRLAGQLGQKPSIERGTIFFADGCFSLPTARSRMARRAVNFDSYRSFPPGSNTSLR